jgi:hypothetical protein
MLLVLARLDIVREMKTSSTKRVLPSDLSFSSLIESEEVSMVWLMLIEPL